MYHRLATMRALLLGPKTFWGFAFAVRRPCLYAPSMPFSAAARSTVAQLARRSILQRATFRLKLNSRVDCGFPVPLQNRHSLVTSAVPVGNSASTEGITVDVLVEGEPLPEERAIIPNLATQLEEDAKKVVREALLLVLEEAAGKMGQVELSVVLCGDDEIRTFNKQWRGKDEATDVLSFSMGEDGGGAAAGGALPVHMLGDLIISLDTAHKQALERGYGLRDECRVLLVHGVLHLVGFDHELGPGEAFEMSVMEQSILLRLGWEGEGLISAQEDAEPNPNGSKNGGGTPATTNGAAATTEPPADSGRGGVAGTSGAASVAEPVSARGQKRKRSSDIKLLALDMDGTLLDSRSKVLPSSVKALRAAMDAGVTVILATGKARPAAVAAMSAVGLAGEGLVVSTKGPGLFLQGLAVHGPDGSLLSGAELPHSVVEQAFMYAQQEQVPLSAFLGDDCVTLQMWPELEELHTRYYEPLSRVAGSVQEILAGPPVKKLLFMTRPEVVDAKLKPHWKLALAGQEAETMQAVATMLEVVPRGVNKWTGMQVLLRRMGLPVDAVMAVGDGGNDLQMVANVGLGVAMGNAVPEVLHAAKVVVADHDNDGVAEAIERYIL